MNTNEPKNVFINLSNHPSSGWSEEQSAAAGAHGEIVDMAFPVVAPDATHEQVKVLAEQCVTEILAQSSGGVTTVHVMGEMTLTYRIVRLLKRRGIRCVASTTERRVTEVDGKKLSEFRFVQFREY